jgi:hypothetical protein
MSGVQTNYGMSGPLYPAAPPASAPAAPPMPAAPAMAPDQVAIQQPTGGAAPDLARIQGQIASGDPVKAAMGLYQLEALAATMGPQVEAILLGQLAGGVPETSQLAAMDILQRMKSAAAVPYLEQIAQNTTSTALRGSAGRALEQITGRGGSLATPAAPAAPVSPNRPLTGPAPAAAAQAQAAAPTPAAPAAQSAGATPAPNMGQLIAQLNNPATAPAAAVAIAQMPTAQALPIIRQALGYELDPKTADMLATILTKRAKEPGVAEGLRDVMKLYPGRYTKATGKAVLTLMSLKDPRYMPEITAYLKTMCTTIAPVKKALIDTIARDPKLLADPELTKGLAGVLLLRESDEAAAAASHALAQIKTKAARDALVDSPLFDAAKPELNMRAMWDLGAHPAPYPEKAIEKLQWLAQSKDKTIANLAKDLLKKSGVKV